VILAIRTDSPEANILLIEQDKTVENLQWPAGRQLAEQLMGRVQELLKKRQLGWDDLEGVVVFRGPGSFTGLRIGMTVANAIAYAQNIPIIGEKGENWLERGLNRLSKKENDRQVLPHYGAPANITKPKK
jgi:tRNA threonylcarbamoyladenosine biosynthesis protein TsaB